MVWMNQNQLAELFDTSDQNIFQFIGSILVDKVLLAYRVVKDYFTTAAGGEETLNLKALLDSRYWYARTSEHKFSRAGMMMANTIS
jgi:hypothetical protein